MTETFSTQFGLIVAYLLPGFVGLAGMAPLAPVVAQWLRPVNQGGLNVGPTVYAILAATTVGMIVSCFRWLLIDHLHQWMGVTRPAWDDSRLEDCLGAFSYLVEIHYRYYQFYANMTVAIALVYSLNRFMNTLPFLGARTDVAVLILCIVLFVGSRDALLNYYAGTGRLLGRNAAKGSTGDPMTNGRDHDHAASASVSSTQAGAKSENKPAVPTKPDSAKAQSEATQR